MSGLHRRTLGKYLEQQGISRRSFLKFCISITSLMALPPSMIPRVVSALEKAVRPSVIWLSFQECTGCTESLTRAHAPTIEGLIFDYISLDYHHTLQAASGSAAEESREAAMHKFQGEYLVVVDGSIPTKDGGVYSTIAGISNYDMLKETAKGAAAIIAVGTCAAYGGIPQASPNPTGAVSVTDIIKDKPIINVPGCPPVPVAISGVLAHYIIFGKIPDLDEIGRPKTFYGQSIHDRCYRRAFFDQKLFAENFDDEGAKKGWCLYKLGCKGPTTYNACATTKWNEGTSFPIESGHGCIGCSEPNFWDGNGFYQPLTQVKASKELSQEDKEDATMKGEAIFENNCNYCHSSGPNPFRTDVKDIPNVLQSKNIRAHRFQFEDDELNDLMEYLSTLNK